jgi:glutathione S-transferase
LVDGEHVIVDSLAICQYLERLHPTPPLWPAGLPGAEVFEYLALVDSAVTILLDVGMRYAPLHEDSHFPAVREHLVGRAERAFALLGAKVQAKGVANGPLCGDAWSAADIALYTTVAWLDGLPARVATYPTAGVILGLGWALPPILHTWADQHRQRADVLALG